jgi:hypothetical protein
MTTSIFEKKVLVALRRLTKKVSDLETRFNGLETKFDGLETKVDGIDGKLKAQGVKLDGVAINVKTQGIKLDDIAINVEAQGVKLDQVISGALPHIEKLTVQSLLLDKHALRLNDHDFRLAKLEKNT